MIDIKRISRFVVITVFMMLPGAQAPAQEMLGTSLGNFAGLNTLQVNPSALYNSKSYLEVQIIGLDLFVQNNYLYIPKSEYRFLNFFDPGYVWPVHQEDYGTEERFLYHYTNLRNKNAYIHTRINGPGAMLVRGRDAFALSTAVRTVSSMVNVPQELANFIYLGLNYPPQQNINYTDKGPVKGSGMSWAEIGASYTRTFYPRGYRAFSAGITVKRLLGLGGVYMNAKNLDYVVPNDSTIDIRNMYATMGLSLPVDYETNEALSSPLLRGGGFGVDLGVTYTRLARHHQENNFNTLCAQPYEDYLFRVGVALIDVGGIKFNRNATVMKIDNRSSYWSDVNQLNTSSIGQFLDTLSYQFYGDYTSAYAGDHFTLWLPSALSVQFDYHLRPDWYVNASLIYGFPLSGSSIARPAELAITPRYETSWFEASLPVSLYNWQLVRVGLAMRVYWLTIGTDKIGGYLHLSDFTGLDFYMSLKLFFNKGSCRDKGPEHCGDGRR